MYCSIFIVFTISTSYFQVFYIFFVLSCHYIFRFSLAFVFSGFTFLLFYEVFYFFLILSFLQFFLSFRHSNFMWNFRKILSCFGEKVLAYWHTDILTYWQWWLHRLPFRLKAGVQKTTFEPRQVLRYISFKSLFRHAWTCLTMPI